MTNFTISDEVRAIGLRGSYLIAKGLRNTHESTEFSSVRQEWINQILPYLNEDQIAGNLVLAGFRELHCRVGVSNRKHISSPENMLLSLLRTGTVPSISLLVDIYNYVSLKYCLAIGAHDIAHVSGNISLRMTSGTERFQPLGYDKTKPIGKGEYAYIDDDNEVICRLEVRQVEKTKVTLDSSECFFIVQGNANTSCELIMNACTELIELTSKYCGGEFHYLHKCLL